MSLRDKMSLEEIRHMSKFEEPICIFSDPPIGTGEIQKALYK